MTVETEPPRRILVAGDWHGNEDWALNVIRRVPGLLAGEPRRLILHLGDFGIWPDRAGLAYLARITEVLAETGAELWFIDGNHEDFGLLAKLDADGATGDGRVRVRPGLYHLPRGYRWGWHGRAWLGCGGAVSLDKAVRTAGADWWPEEEITAAQVTAISAAGHADVLVSHDCPAGVQHDLGRLPPGWDLADLARSQAHQQRLRGLVDAVRPSYVMHGHLHRAYQQDCDFGYGPVRVTGLAADGRLRNFAVLDVSAMQWEPRGGRSGWARRRPGRHRG